VLEVADGGMAQGPLEVVLEGRGQMGRVGALAKWALMEVALSNICEFNSL
jgi:hypothetical protein